MEKRHLRIDLIIHLFALAHAAVVVLSRLFDYVDNIPLTILTILMIIIIAVRRNLSVELIVALVMAGCFIGYALGICGAEALNRLVGSFTLASAITTAIVTELLGWATFAVSQFRSQRSDDRHRYPDTAVIITIGVLIMIVRIAYEQIFSSPLFERTSLSGELHKLLSDSFALVFMLGGCIIIANLPSRLKKRNKGLFYAMVVALLVGLSLLVAVFACCNTGNDAGFVEPVALAQMLLAVLPVCATVYAVLLLVIYVVNTRTKFLHERDKRHKALYQYDTLKRQINPHFLFNSLNILEYLVEEGESARATAFIRKLAGMYRYMLTNDEKRIVPLDEELDFARKYIDLLRERFAEGFSVEIDISDRARKCFVIPCSVQLLVENAIKHNIVSPDSPLRIVIADEGDMLCVGNNLQPRLSNRDTSTGMGLKNIGQQYEDIAGRDIAVIRTKTSFKVKLPLLQSL